MLYYRSGLTYCFVMFISNVQSVLFGATQYSIYFEFRWYPCNAKKPPKKTNDLTLEKYGEMGRDEKCSLL